MPRSNRYTRRRSMLGGFRYGKSHHEKYNELHDTIRSIPTRSKTRFLSKLKSRKVKSRNLHSRKLNTRNLHSRNLHSRKLKTLVN